MCGIVGMVGADVKIGEVLDALKKLEYRGYDSAGIAYLSTHNTLNYHKKKGRIDELLDLMRETLKEKTQVAIAHTRWATHGEPNDVNAHPHIDCTNKIAVVHNGIIENYSDLRERLIAKGHVFVSETDTEVIAHLIEDNYRGDLLEAVRRSIVQLNGAYAVGVIHADEPRRIVVARKGSPLVIGKNERVSMLASDVTPLLSYTRDVIFLEDGELAVLEKGRYRIFDPQGNDVVKTTVHIDWKEADAEKGGYKHYMLKEIMEEPEALRKALADRIKEDRVYFEELEKFKKNLREVNRIMVVACGTSYHAGLVFKYFVEWLSDLDVEVDVASEFRYRNLHVNERTLILAISQSGETADTLQGVRLAKRKEGKVIAVCNVVGSTLTRESDAAVYIRSGPEIGVAATKTYTSQLAVLYLLGLYIISERYGWNKEFGKLIYQMRNMPEVIEGTLAYSDQLREMATRYKDYLHFMYIGRGMSVPTAMEGALKLKEISYINATAYQAGELKHGPIALLDEQFPVFAIIPRDRLFYKTKSNVIEAVARNAPVISLATERDEEVGEFSKDVIYVPKVNDLLYPLVMAPYIQLFAYHVSDLKGLDPDKPRNLAKSVTVE